MLAGVFKTSKPGFATLKSLVPSMTKAIDPSTRVQLSLFDQPMTNVVPLANKVSKEIVEAVPVIEDGYASFEFVLRFPFAVHIEGWREVMELRQKEDGGEVCDWSQAVPNEFYALCDLLDYSHAWDWETQEDLLDRLKAAASERIEELRPMWICPACLVKESKTQPPQDGPRDLF